MTSVKPEGSEDTVKQIHLCSVEALEEGGGSWEKERREGGGRGEGTTEGGREIF